MSLPPPAPKIASEGLEIWQAEVIADARGVQEPEQKLELVFLKPSEESAELAKKPSPRQSACDHLRERLNGLPNNAPNQRGPGELLRDLNHQNRHKRRERIDDKHGKPLRRNPSLQPSYHRRRLALPLISPVTRQPRGTFDQEEHRKQKRKPMLLEPGEIPSARFRFETRFLFHSRRHRWNHVMPHPPHDADNNAAEELGQECQH